MAADQPLPVVLDGELTDTARAVVSVADEGLLRGDGVFEVIRLYDGRPFAVDDHLERMSRSAAGLRLPFDAHAVRADLAVAVKAAPGFDGSIRVLVTRGGRRIALIERLRELPATLALATVTYAPPRILDGIKSLSYGANMLATRLAQEEGADDALLTTPHGRILEAPTKSFFYVLDGQLCTPPLSDHILDSITRRRLMRVAEVQERVTTRDELAGAQEAFLASTGRAVHPVHAVDDIAFAAAPGPVSAEAARRMHAHVEAELAT